MAAEYDFLALGKQKSERPSMFGKLNLQKDKNILKSADIRRLIKRHMQMWKDDLLEEFIQEAELCDKNCPNQFLKCPKKKQSKFFQE